MSTNPYKYVPKIALSLQDMHKGSPQYKKTIRMLAKNPFFSSKLTECLIDDIDDERLKRVRSKLSDDTRNTFMFLCMCVGEGIFAGLMRVGLFGETFRDYSMYVFAASIVAVPFLVFCGSKSSSRMRQFAEIYLDDFKRPSERFTDDLMQSMADAVTSGKDVIEQHELDMKIPCGCYSCRHTFTSDMLKDAKLTGEYVCPFCGETTIVSDRCGHHVTEQFLNDLYEYWHS